MSEEDKNIVPVITKEQIAEFFEAKSISKDCPSCSKNDWVLFNRLENDIPVIMTLPETGFIKPQPLSIPFLFMICKNCGFVRSHALKVLDDWINSKKTDETF